MARTLNATPNPHNATGDGLQCRFCDGWYSSRRNLRRHKNRCHTDLLEFPCDVDGCNLRFVDEYAKQIHMGQIHPDEFESVRRLDDPRVRRVRNLRRLYGITPIEYQKMLEDQGGTCATCSATDADSSGKRLHVDHCHETGAVRGLLCTNCNHTLGKVDDDPARLRRLADYLEAAHRG